MFRKNRFEILLQCLKRLQSTSLERRHTFANCFPTTGQQADSGRFLMVLVQASLTARRVSWCCPLRDGIWNSLIVPSWSVRGLANHHDAVYRQVVGGLGGSVAECIVMMQLLAMSGFTRLTHIFSLLSTSRSEFSTSCICCTLLSLLTGRIVQRGNRPTHYLIHLWRYFSTLKRQHGTCLHPWTLGKSCLTSVYWISSAQHRIRWCTVI